MFVFLYTKLQMLTDIHKIAKEISPITLKEMDAVALMKRTDTKFVVSKKTLPALLETLKEKYRVLEIDNNRVMTYNSLYFDTKDQKFYREHHNGKINRLKVRMRKYVESELFFLEIKQKDHKGRTTKSRIPIKNFEKELSLASNDFIEKITAEKLDLTPALMNGFNRITLVNMQSNERVTIDFNLTYTLGDVQKTYEGIAIIEVKQERFDRSSAIVKELRNHRQFPYSISKYCIGMVNLYENLKYNQFKRKLIKLNKLTA